jgi:hypothetical protein
VSAILERHGVSRRYRILTSQDVEAAVRLYESGLSLRSRGRTVRHERVDDSECVAYDGRENEASRHESMAVMTVLAGWANHETGSGALLWGLDNRRGLI